MEEQIIEWLRATVATEDQFESLVKDILKAKQEEGYRLVYYNWDHRDHYEGPAPFNKVQDAYTGEVLYYHSGDPEHHDAWWNPSWWSVESVRDRAYDEIDYPRPPEDIAWLLTDDIDPSDAREFLKDYDA